MRCFATLALLAALLVPLSAPASGYHDPCGGRIGPSELGMDDAVVDLAGKFYLHVQSLAEDGDHWWSIWVYQEANGEPGLQRGDGTHAVDDVICRYNPCLPVERDPCVQAHPPDSLIF